MVRSPRFSFWSVAAGLLAAGTVAAVLAAVWWMPTEYALAQRVAAAATEQLGVPVRVGRLHWQLFPTPRVDLEDVATDQPQPLQLRRLSAFPRLAPLLRGRVALERLELEGAVVFQASLRGLGPKKQSVVPVSSMAPTAPLPVRGLDAVPVAQVMLRDVQWVARTGIAVAFDGELDFDPLWRPRRAELRRPGFLPATSLTALRQGGEDRWRLDILLGGGTVNGEVALQTAADGGLHLSGMLLPKGVEVQAAMASFNRRSPVAGEASGQTRVSAQGHSVAGLAQSLQTVTTFTMVPASLVRLDVAKAVRTRGADATGTTPIDTLSGQLDTQNSAEGMVSRFTQLKARSGLLSAAGEVTLAQQQVDGTFAVALVDGLVGVSLRVQGPVQTPRFSVTGGSLAGAALGTAVLPGVGTAIGARVGGFLGQLFGGGAPAAPRGKASGPASKPPAKPPAAPPEDPNKLWR